MAVHRLSDRDEADARAAHAVLDAHVPDKESGLCAACLEAAPCGPANAAANRLVELGRPVLPDGPPPARPAAWRSRWFPHRRGRYRTAPLLTHVWRLRFGMAMARPATVARPTVVSRPATVACATVEARPATVVRLAAEARPAAVASFAA